MTTLGRFSPKSADNILVPVSPVQSDRNITMQNTVELNALTLTSNVYLNSTTKYVKGLPSSSSPPASQTLLPVTHSPKSQKYSAQQSLGNSNMPQGSHNKSPGPVPRNIGLPSPSQMKETPSLNPLEMAALNLSATVFMNSTTKFVKGFADLTPVQQATSRSPKQKKSLSEGKKKEESPKKSIDPEANPKGRTQKTPEKNAMDMTAANYMNSTTKYVKTKIDESQVKPANGKVDKIIKNNTTARSSNEKLGSMLDNNCGKGEKSQVEKKRTESPQSNSSSGGRIARKKDRDRTRQLKFLQKRQPEESDVTVKDRAASLDFKNRRNDTKIVQQQEKQSSKPEISQLILNSQQYIAPNDAKLPSISSTTSINQLEARPPLIRHNRNAVNEVKSANARPVEKKEETGKPFARQPQNARPQLVQKAANEPPKIPNTLPSGQLPLETPMKTKIQSSKQIDQQANLLKVKPQQTTQHQISVIREERSSLVQNTKTSINNKKSYHGSTKEDLASQASPPQTQIQPNKINQNSKFARTNQEKIQSVKEVPMGVRTTTTSVLEQRKSPQGLKPVQSKKAIKTEPEEKGSTTSIQQPTIDVNNSKKNISNNNSSPTHPLQNKKSLPLTLETSKPQEQSLRLKAQQERNAKQVNKIQAARSIQAKNEEQKNIGKEAGNNKEAKTVKSTRLIQSKLEEIKPKEKQINTKTNYPTSRPTKETQKQIIQIQSVQSIQTKKNNSAPSSSPSIKVQEPMQSAKSIGSKQDEAKIVSKQENTISSLRKSYVLSQLCSKFYYRLIFQAFSSISKHSHTSQFHSKQGLILSLQTVSTYKNIEKSFLASCFAQIKRVSSFKFPSRKEISSHLGKEIASGILFRVIGSKQREYFEAIKQHKAFSQPKPIQKKERTQNEKDGKETKAYHLYQLKKIVETLSRNKVQNSFNKILFFSSWQQKKSPIQPNLSQSRSPSKYTRPPRDYQVQKSSLLQTKSQLQSSISSIESRMAEKKRYSDVQKMRMIKKQQQMTQKNKKLEEELTTKRKNNKELKGQLETLSQKEDLDISLPDYEPLVGLLTEIYSTIFAYQEEKIDVAALSRKYDLAKEDRNLLLDMWSSLTRNAQLKAQIAKWQGSDPFSSGHQRQRRQNDALGSLMRNLIRERYMWEWVKTIAEKA